ncbi:MAG: hypothetical protein B6U94_06285, partial [Thermofilum sp. ex4484_79]
IIQIAKYRGIQPEQALENIIYARAASLNELLEIVASLKKVKDVGIVLLDSLPSLFIAPEDVREYKRNLGIISYVLKFLLDYSLDNDASIVVTNMKINDKVFGDPFVSIFISKRLIIERTGERERSVRYLFPLSSKTSRFTIERNGLR